MTEEEIFMLFIIKITFLVAPNAVNWSNNAKNSYAFLISSDHLASLAPELDFDSFSTVSFSYYIFFEDFQTSVEIRLAINTIEQKDTDFDAIYVKQELN